MKEGILWVGPCLQMVALDGEEGRREARKNGGCECIGHKHVGIADSIQRLG